MSDSWTYRVVKKQRGEGGKWFAYPGKAFDSEQGAREYARAFAAEQAGVPGTRIVVLSRGGQIVDEYFPPASR